MKLRLPTAWVDLDALTGSRGGTTFSITQQEARLLRYLALRAGVPVTREELHTRVLEYDGSIRTRAIDATVSRLRAKIEPEPRAPQSLISIRGRGYALHVDGESSGYASPLLPGRTALRAALERAVREHQGVQLVGPGGAGKTSLAREWIRHHGGVFVNLRGCGGAGEALTALGRAFGVRGDRRDAMQDRLAAVLAHRGVVIVCDEMEGVEPAFAQTLVDLQRTAGTSIVLTSRTPFVPGWLKIEVDGVPEPVAVDLIVRRARELDPYWEPEAASDLAALAARIDRLPLACRLVGAQLTHTRARELEARLRDRSGVLEAVVQRTWEAADPPVRAAVERWAVARCGLSLEAAEQLAGVEDVLSVMDAARVAGLLQPGAGIQLWEVVRSFARQVTAETDRVTHLGALARIRLREVESGASAIDLAEDLRAALDGLTAAEPSLAAKCGLALLWGGHSLAMRDRERVHEQAAAAARGSDELSAEVFVAGLLVQDREACGLDALAKIEHALHRCESPRLRHLLLKAKARSLRFGGQITEAIETYAEASGVARSLDDWLTVADLEYCEAAARRRIGDLKGAYDLLQSVIAAHPSPRLESQAYQELAAIIRTEDPQRAVVFGEQGVQIARDSKDPVTIGAALTNLGAAQHSAGLSAIETFTEAVDVLRGTGKRTTLAIAIGNLGAEHDRQGRDIEAELAYREALHVSQRTNWGYPTAYFRYRLAERTYRSGRAAEAVPILTRAIAELRSQEMVPLLHRAHALAAILHAELETGKADSYLEQAMPLAQGSPVEQGLHALAWDCVAVLTSRKRRSVDVEALRAWPELEPTLDLWHRISTRPPKP